MAGVPDGEATIEARIGTLATQIAQRLNRILDVLDEQEPPEPIVGWRDHAACKHTFNPAMKGEETMVQHRANQQALKLLCAGCPVTHECYQYALQIGAKEGIWGGKVFGQKRKRLTG